MALSPMVKERVAGSIWAGAWLWPLITPAVACAQGQVAYPVLAGLGLLVFVVLYLIVVTNAFDDERLRRGAVARRDLVYVLALAAVGLTLFFAYADSPSGWLNIMLYIAVTGVATFRPKLAGAWALSVVGITVGWALHPRSGPPAHSSDIAQFVFGTLMAGALVLVVKQMMSYIRLLRDTRAELARNAVNEERLRFARDLHDLLGHTMSLIVVKAEVVRRLAEREPRLAAEAAADIEAIGRRALTEVRDAVDGYRAPEFAVELDSVRMALAAANIAVRVRHDGPPVPAPASYVFGWAIREAATNVIRHSGAHTCEVIVTVDRETATLEVQDDGHGARVNGASSGGPAERRGVGLVGLEERVVAAGGTLTTGNLAHGGFRLVATMPTATIEVCADVVDPPLWAPPAYEQRPAKLTAGPHRASADGPSVSLAPAGEGDASTVDAPLDAEPAHADRTEPEPAHTDRTEPEAAQTDRIGSEPAPTNPTESEPARPGRSETTAGRS